MWSASTGERQISIKWFLRMADCCRAACFCRHDADSRRNFQGRQIWQTTNCCRCSTKQLAPHAGVVLRNHHDDLSHIFGFNGGSKFSGSPIWSLPVMAQGISLVHGDGPVCFRRDGNEPALEVFIPAPSSEFQRSDFIAYRL